MSQQELSQVRIVEALVGAIETEVTPQGVVPWRIYRGWLPLLSEGEINRAVEPAGVRLRIETDSPSVTLGVETNVPGAAGDLPANLMFDVLVDGQMHERRVQPRGDCELTFTGWSAGSHVIELYLQQKSPLRITRVALEAGASCKLGNDPRPRWVTHGSSITQAGQAAGPTETWPAIVAAKLNLNHTNLGYGGNCIVSQLVARMIAATPADYLTLCLGINVVGGYDQRTFRAAVAGFILTVRDGHPTTPLVCVSPICSPPREVNPTATGMTLPIQRDIIRKVVMYFREMGDANLHYADGSALMSQADMDVMPDELHPNAQGQPRLAQRYLEKVMPILGF